MSFRRAWNWGKTLAIMALPLISIGCSSNHNTEVQLPNGVRCSSQTQGSFFWQTTNFSCTDANGKVIGSYKSS
jgi:hypothetical protein